MKNFLKNYWESIIRIFFLTFFMTAIVTYWKIWYEHNYFINWMKTWGMVALIAYIFMCFIIRPYILDSFDLEWKKRQIVWMFLLIFIFTFIFSYKFDWVNVNNIELLTLIKNFWILTVIVFPVWILLAWPIAKSCCKFY